MWVVNGCEGGALKKPGMPPAEVRELTRVEDRLTFLYLERCTVHREDNAITAHKQEGTVHIPASTIGALFLGPGTRITHQAMCLLADSGATTVWVGEHGVRYYGHGQPLGRSTRLLQAQAKLVSNQRSRLAVARHMYSMRFPDEDISRLTMQQLRGREGARVRRAYRKNAEKYDIQWGGRTYDSEDFDSSDLVNQALSSATAALYGLVHAVVVALGCSPGLGFIHTGHSRSFVFDIADLYKADCAIPCAFEVAASDPFDVGAETRLAMRQIFRDGTLLERIVRDVRNLLLQQQEEVVEGEDDSNVVYLWDGSDSVVAAGVSYPEVDW